MAAFDFITYMKDCATRLKDIGHVDGETEKFFRISGLSDLEEYLQKLSDAQYPALLVQDNQDGNVGDVNRSDNLLDNPYFVFYVVSRPGYLDADSQESAKKICKTIGFKILAKMRHDKRNGLNGLDFLQFGNVPYQTIGPIGDQAVGVMFSFTVTDAANLVYDINDWQ